METVEFCTIADVSSAVFQLDQHFLSNDENSNDFHWINNNISFVHSYKNYYQIT